MILEDHFHMGTEDMTQARLLVAEKRDAELGCLKGDVFARIAALKNCICNLTKGCASYVVSPSLE
jgi:hypothetical protein